MIFASFSIGPRKGYGLIAADGVIDLSTRFAGRFPTLKEVVEADAFGMWLLAFVERILVPTGLHRFVFRFAQRKRHHVANRGFIVNNQNGLLHGRTCQVSGMHQS